MTILRAALVLSLLAASATQEKPKEYSKRIALKVASRTWRDKKAFDIDAAVRKKLDEAGLQALAAEAPGADATMIVDYSETKGPGYGVTDMDVQEYGTKITCTVRLVGPGMSDEDARVLFIQTATPEKGEMFGLYGAALKEFKADPTWVYLEHLVAADLGVKESFLRLMELLRQHPHAPAALILKKQGWEPVEARDQAYLAAARRDYVRCAELGTAAGDALLLNLMALKKQTWDRSKFQPALGPEDERLLKALAAVGERRAGPPVLELCAKFGALHPKIDYPGLILLLETYGDVGDDRGLDALKAIERGGNPTVEAAAKAAAGKITARQGK